MNNTIPAETGCWIDGSHRSNFDFMCMVIEMAESYGFEMDFDQFVKDVQGIRDDLFTDDDIYDIMDALDWTYEDALEYLNENTAENLAWIVQENSLFLIEISEEEL